MKRIAVLTTGRQDWGILRSLCLELVSCPSLELCLIVGGMHWSQRFGATARLILEDGLRPAESLRWIPEDGEAGAVEQAAGALAQVGAALERQRPRALVLVGDRFETAAAALASMLAGVPIVHLHGGEESSGSLDDAFRHAITKLSHLHLVSHAKYRERVIAMGEDPASVIVVGAPGLDNLHREDLASRNELETAIGIPLEPPVVIVTLHPATAGGDPAREAAAVCEALERVPATYVITLPNTDPGHDVIRRALGEAAARLPRTRTVEALGERRYWGLMKVADAMLGNSSSALIEAPAIGLPAVNVGERQGGRLRGANVLDAAGEPAAIAEALARALDPGFRAGLRGGPGPFGDGRSGRRVAEVLAGWCPPEKLAKPGQGAPS